MHCTVRSGFSFFCFPSAGNQFFSDIFIISQKRSKVKSNLAARFSKCVHGRTDSVFQLNAPACLFFIFLQQEHILTAANG